MSLSSDAGRTAWAWLMERHSVPDQWREEFYEQAVESAILGDFWKVTRFSGEC